MEQEKKPSQFDQGQQGQRKEEEQRMPGQGQQTQKQPGQDQWKQPGQTNEPRKPDQEKKEDVA